MLQLLVVFNPQVKLLLAKRDNLRPWFNSVRVLLAANLEKKINSKFLQSIQPGKVSILSHIFLDSL